MSTLPKVLRLAPRVFYAAAVVVWVFTVWSNWQLIESSQQFPGINPDRAEQLADIVVSEVFVRGFIDAVYMAANGVMVHVLIAIHDRLGGMKEAAE